MLPLTETRGNNVRQRGKDRKDYILDTDSELERPGRKRRHMRKWLPLQKC